MPIPEKFLKMISPRFQNCTCKICALIAATLILPALAYSGQNDQGNQNGQGQNNVPVVPEANAGSVLVPFFGAVLLFFGATALRSKVVLAPRRLASRNRAFPTCDGPARRVSPFGIACLSGFRAFLTPSAEQFFRSDNSRTLSCLERKLADPELFANQTPIRSSRKPRRMRSSRRNVLLGRRRPPRAIG